jgi:hypothetical protein
MADIDWHIFKEGATLGTEGSECGSIVRDDEHTLGARITLERKTQTAPFAITCGVYGWMVHTRFFQFEIEANAEYDRMKTALAAILSRAPKDGSPTPEFEDELSAFIAACP